ncbi:MAG: hypothetical protein U0610_06250 [bacterium]
MISKPDSSDTELLERLLALDELLPTLAGVLDVRQVFERLSTLARRVIAHDMLLMTLLADDRGHVTVRDHRRRGDVSATVIALTGQKVLARSLVGGVTWWRTCRPSPRGGTCRRARADTGLG